MRCREQLEGRFEGAGKAIPSGYRLFQMRLAGATGDTAAAVGPRDSAYERGTG